MCIDWNAVSAIATALATGVALYASFQARSELKSALRIQEQSKNVELLDKRIELAEDIRSGKSVSELKLQILFNDEIFKHYRIWRDYLTEKVYAEHDLEIFYRESRQSDFEGGYKNDTKDAIEKYQYAMSRPDCPQEIYEKYEDFCKEHTLLLMVGDGNERTAYNHSEISKRIAIAENNAKTEQNLVIQLIEKLISESIQSLDAKPKQKGSTSKRESRKDQDGSN